MKQVNHKTVKQGFTMIELLVAMSLFVIVIAIVSGIFIQSLRTQRATVALIAANSNAALVIEQIMREIRTGRDFNIYGNTADIEGEEIRFINAKGEEVTYHPTEKLVDEKSIKSLARNNLAVTADNVMVENLKFYLPGESPPRVTIILQIGAVGVPSAEPFINLQTTVSSRAPL